jgi:hypothetical protein
MKVVQFSKRFPTRLSSVHRQGALGLVEGPTTSIYCIYILLILPHPYKVATEYHILAPEDERKHTKTLAIPSDFYLS